MSERHPRFTAFPLTKVRFADPGEDLLAMFLQSQNHDDGRTQQFACLITAEMGRQFLQELSNALALKGIHPTDGTTH